jgi:ribosome-associated protein
MESLKISTEYIKLDQFLKYASLISSGAEAKIIIKEGNVKVNGEVELQRGKKLRSGDTIEYNGKSFRIE